VKAGPGQVVIRLGLPFVGLEAAYEVAKMRNLRVEQPAPKSGKSWRGRHFAFDYGANTFAFGSDVEAMELGAVESGVRMASGKSIRKGDASREEVEEQWASSPESLILQAVDEPEVEMPPAADSSGTWLTASALALIVANLVPVAGAVFFGWALSDVMVLYWAESAVIGLFNLCKIVVIGRWAALFAGPFFIGHFGGFMAVHFLFIYSIFVQGAGASGGPDAELSEVAALFTRLWPALLALFASHAYSFVTNFLGRGEYRGRPVSKQMSEPYSRIVFMHLVLIFGGGLTLVIGESTPVLLIVIALKIVFDIRAHRRQRQWRKADTQAADDPV
jgi:hypothetical protein